MRSADHITVRHSARAVVPIAALVAVAIVASGGSGLAAGALFALTVVLHAVVFGTAAAQRAFGPAAWRIAGALALLALVIAVSAPDWPYAPLLSQAALALALAAALGLAMTMLMARATALRDEEW